MEGSHQALHGGRLRGRQGSERATAQGTGLPPTPELPADDRGTWRRSQGLSRADPHSPSWCHTSSRTTRPAPRDPEQAPSWGEAGTGSGACPQLPNANEGGERRGAEGGGEEPWGKRDAHGRDWKEKEGERRGRKVCEEVAGQLGAQWGPRLAGAPGALAPGTPPPPTPRPVQRSPGLSAPGRPFNRDWVSERRASRLLCRDSSLRRAILIGPGRGPPLLTLQSLPPREEPLPQQERFPPPPRPGRRTSYRSSRSA